MVLMKDLYNGADERLVLWCWWKTCIMVLMKDLYYGADERLVYGSDQMNEDNDYIVLFYQINMYLRDMITSPMVKICMVHIKLMVFIFEGFTKIIIRIITYVCQITTITCPDMFNCSRVLSIHWPPQEMHPHDVCKIYRILLYINYPYTMIKYDIYITILYR